MATTDGWYLIGPMIAVSLVGFLGAVFWRMGLRWTRATDDDTLRDLHGLAIFTQPDDFGLLCPAAVTEHPHEADEIRELLAMAGIRATSAIRADGRLTVLVFAEHIEEARRLVGPASPY